MEKAREFFVSSRDDEEAPVKQPVILRLVDSINVDMEQLKKDESNLPAADGK